MTILQYHILSAIEHNSNVTDTTLNTLQNVCATVEKEEDKRRRFGSLVRLVFQLVVFANSQVQIFFVFSCFQLTYCKYSVT